MSTAANYGTSQLDPKPRAVPQAPRMIERKEPEFIKFAEGEVVEGILKSIERIQVGTPAKDAIRYTVADVATGELSSFLGCYQIDTKLRRDDLGHYITVRYEGEDSSVRRNGNSMKRFKVFVSELRYNGQPEDGTFITNEDIGF